MSEYRRYFVPGGTYFFTVVTENRWRLFEEESARRLLGAVIRECVLRFPWNTVAILLLPDHLHAIWTLPPGDDPVLVALAMDQTGVHPRLAGSRRLGRAPVGITQARATARRLQRRFWEHTIRDETDLENHFDYIHYNPVKHGLAQAALRLALVELPPLGPGRSLCRRLGRHRRWTLVAG